MVREGHGIRPAVETDSPNDWIADHDAWEYDLKRWALAFEVYTRDDYHHLHGDDHAAWHQDEKSRYREVLAAWKEIGPWFGGLWT